MTEAAGVHSDVSVTRPARDRAEANSRSLSAAGYLLMTSTAAAWTGVVGGLAIWRHNQFLSHRYDLGNMVQAVWSTAHGRPLQVTDGETGEQVVRLVSHVDPALLLFVPAWWIRGEPETLILVQAAAIAAGIYPVVRLALKYVGSGLAAALFGAWYLAFPWVIWSAINDVHAVTLAIPLLLYAVWFLDEHHLGRFAVFGALAVLTGELVGLTVAMLGIWYAIRYRRLRAGIGIAVAGTAWTAICLAFVIPALNDGRPSPFYDRFESVGGSPAGLVTTLFTDPGAILAAVTTAADGRLVLALLLPTALLALGEPLLLAAALPQLSVNALTDWRPATEPEYQYVAPILAPLLTASIMAVRRLPERMRILAAAAPLAVGIVALAHTPPIPGGHDWVFGSREPAERRAAAARAIDLIPPQVAVTTTNRLGAHLSARREIYLFPTRSQSAWMAIDTYDSFLVAGGERTDPSLFGRLLANVERDSTWRLVFDSEGIRVYRKRS